MYTVYKQQNFTASIMAGYRLMSTTNHGCLVLNMRHSTA